MHGLSAGPLDTYDCSYGLGPNNGQWVIQWVQITLQDDGLGTIARTAHARQNGLFRPERPARQPLDHRGWENGSRHVELRLSCALRCPFAAPDLISHAPRSSSATCNRAISSRQRQTSPTAQARCSTGRCRRRWTARTTRQTSQRTRPSASRHDQLLSNSSKRADYDA